jgi:hypothetical protein
MIRKITIIDIFFTELIKSLPIEQTFSYTALFLHCRELVRKLVCVKNAHKVVFINDAAQDSRLGNPVSLNRRIFSIGHRATFWLFTFILVCLHKNDRINS